MMNNHVHKPYLWVLSLYFFQGLPFAIVNFLSLIFYQQLGVSNFKNTLLTSLLLLPWSIKPLFTIVLEIISSPRHLAIFFQFLIGSLLIILGFLLSSDHFFVFSLIIFFITAFFSSQFDIVSDGMYLKYLSIEQQKFYIGIRTCAYQFARLFVTGFLVYLISSLTYLLSLFFAWKIAFVFLGLVAVSLAFYHSFVLPKQKLTKESGISSILALLKFIKENLWGYDLLKFLLFIIFYNMAEGQLIKIFPLFMLSHHNQHGLGLSLKQLSFIYGTLALSSVVVGALCYSFLSKYISINRALLLFGLLNVFANTGYIIIYLFPNMSLNTMTILICFAQFSFGLSNSSYMACLSNSLSKMDFSMTLYAFATAFMNLGYIITGVTGGYIQSQFGFFSCFNANIIFGLIIAIMSYFYIKSSKIVNA